MPVRIIEKRNDTQKFLRSIKPAVQKVLRSTAQKVAQGAGDNAPRDTGALAASYYVLGSDIDGYSDALAAAASLRADMVVLDKVEAPPDDMTYYVSSVAGHQPFIELGTVHMGAQPHLVPAAESLYQDFISDLSSALGGLL